MLSGIYKIYFIDNPNKLYIGKSKNILQRKKEHFRKLRYGKHINSYLQNAYNKHKLDNIRFEIIELCNLELLKEREIYYINYYNTMKDGYNLTSGGEGDNAKSKSILDKAFESRIKNGTIKKIYAYSNIGEYIGVYNGPTEAGRILGVGESNVRQVLYKKMKTAKTIHFSFNIKSKEQVVVDTMKNNFKQEYKNKMSIKCSGSGNPMYGRVRLERRGKMFFNEKNTSKIPLKQIVDLVQKGYSINYVAELSGLSAGYIRSVMGKLNISWDKWGSLKKEFKEKV